MDIKQILTADVLDIVFEGRNKDYGAYELRKTYNKRLITAMIAAMVFISLFFCGYLLAKNSTAEMSPIYVDEVILKKVPENKVEPPVINHPKQPDLKQVKTVKHLTPLIVTDQDVPKDEMPPEQSEIEEAKIGYANLDGAAASDIVAPPLGDDRKGILDQPKKQEEDEDKLFIRVEIESAYPGGASSWIRFIKKNLSNYPEEALEKEIQGTVVVQFVVDKEGHVSDVQAVSGPEELKAAAETVIKKSGKWIPAEQNGRKVKSLKKQPISFRLGE